MFRDVRHSLRLIRRHPAYALTVLLTLAVAIGAGTVVIALTDAIVLRPLPFRDSERVVSVWETNPQVGRHSTASYPNLRDWAAASKSFEALALARSWMTRVDRGSESNMVDSGTATPRWFTILSVQPALGRFFTDADMRKGNNHVVVLSNKMWRSDFGADPRVLQQQLSLGGEPYQIIGVLPEKAWLYNLDYAKLWIPLTAIEEDVEERSWRGFVGLGRLRPGVPVATARQELATIEQRLAAAYPKEDANWDVGMEPLRDIVAGPARKMLLIFSAAIAFVLLIACANIANLALAFNSWRTREFALRYAVGAGTNRIAAQILIESVVLALLGGALGLALAHSGLAFFKAVAPEGIPRIDEVSIDPRVALITTALSIVTALLFGILPARAAARAGVMSGNRSTGPGTGLRKALVVAELALAFVLVTASGLMTRAFARLAGWEPGFRPAGLSEVWCLAKDLRQEHQAVELFDQAARAIEAIPGVTIVGQTSAGPLFGGTEESALHVAGGATAPARWFDVSPNYLRTLGVPLLRGRELKDSDREGSEPVALINDAAARRFFGNADPIGARVEVEKLTWTIVGVVGNVNPMRPDETPQPEIYWPKRQMRRLATYFVIRSSLPPVTLEQQVRDVVAKQLPALQLGSGFHTIPELAAGKRVSPRFDVIVVSALSVLAFLLAAIGIYGVVAFSIVSRAREIAIRLAIGADPRRVVREIVTGGGRMLAVGLLIGVAAAIALARFLSAYLFGLSPFDPLTWLGVSLAFALVVMIACWLPARRAAAIDPATSLRAE